MCSESTDQRYVARPQGATCDIGAFELDKLASVTLALAPNAAFIKKTGAATVTGTVSCSAAGVVALNVTLTQPQKTKGNSSTVVQAAGTTNVNCVVGATSWSIVLTPATGAFVTGAATGSARTSGGLGFLASSVTSTLNVK